MILMLEKRGLQKIEHEVGYTTFSSDVYSEFLIPCLNNSKEYNRFSGYFSSKVFIYLLEGIKNFIKNDGKINLVLGRLPPKDFDIINASKDELEALFLDELLLDIEKVAHNSSKDHSLLLAWLLYHGHLNIKYAIINLKLETDKIEEMTPGFLHSKLGIFYDEFGNGISYIGSPNFTLQAYAYNFEDFDVFNNWEDETNKKHFDRHEKNFKEFWSNNKDMFVVVDLPTSDIKLKLTEPNKIEEEIFDKIDSFNKKLRDSILNEILERKRFDEELEKEETSETILEVGKEVTLVKDITQVKWRKPQIEGYQKWIKNDKKGILEIATGVGKTLIAIRAIYEFFIQKSDNNKRKIAAIALPDNLIDQWEEELKEWLVDENGKTIPKIISIYSDPSKKKSVPKMLKKLEDDFTMLTKPLVILAYYNTFSSKVIPMLNRFKNKKILFIADEVHDLGTSTRRKYFLKFQPDHLMGLSATPQRYFDDDGTKFLLNYFKNGIIYNYEINDGIKDGYLCEYKYYPLICSLTAKEREDYDKATKQIVALKNKIDKETNRARKVELKREYDTALFRRKRIVKKAESKLPIVQDLISDLKTQDELKYVLIYTEDDEQLGQLYDYLIDSDYSVTKITRHEVMSERKTTIKQIKSGIRQILLAERILDQGIDIPNLKYGIIISSTGNIRQHIQRRGRLLRISNVKKFSTIYDLVVNDIESELKRVLTFYNDCMNNEEVGKLLLDNGIIIENIKGEDIAERE